ncbi:MAG TPA: M56 family metallopeptidase [Terracidiphilus sp.]|nr:M56 family metallopeptidase [Terracidiphilus sp.]
MTRFEDWVLAYLVNALWQIPLVFASAWLAARLASRLGARAEHRIWVAALLAQAALPSCSLSPARLWSVLRSLITWGNAPGGETHVVLSSGVATGSGALYLPPVVAALLLVVCAGGALYYAARMAWGLVATHNIVRRAEPLPLEGEFAACWASARRVFSALSGDPGFAPALASSAGVSGPVTIGSRMLLLPPGFLNQIPAAEFDALLAHEFSHMARHDFAKNLVYALVSLPVSWHPAVALTRARLGESRERVCDAMAADAVSGRERYARSLLRLASLLSSAAPAGVLHALGIFDSNNLERRIMNLTGKSTQLHGLRRMAVLAACVAVGAIACTSALALHADVNQPSAKSPNGPVHVKADHLKIVNKVPPVYPPQAKADRLTGTVTLDVVVGKDGSVENIKVAKSLRDDCDQSAIDAVRQWKFEPVLLSGEPIEVKTTIQINYSLKK